MLFTAARLLTSPQLDSKCWLPGLCAASIPNAALFLLVASGHAASRIITSAGGIYMPVWVVVLISSLPFAVLLYAALSSREPPKAMLLRMPLLLVGFITSCTWTYLLAAELVNVLDTLGAVLGVSRTILGLTVMAWGNSLGDLVTDTALARSGNPRIGAAACFGGPIFNMLVGNGISMSIVASRNHGRFCLEYDSTMPLGVAFLVGSVLLTSGSVMCQRWHLTRLHGGALLTFYVCFLFWTIAVAMRGWAHYDNFFKSLIIPECRQ
jgi:sodium/potassium/calcium exchanger 6